MAEKAVIHSVFGLKRDASGNFVLLVTASITDGTESFHVLTTQAVSATILPIAPTWRSLIKSAVIADALAKYGITVDEVISPDFLLLL
jgi:hypothetical protein